MQVRQMIENGNKVLSDFDKFCKTFFSSRDTVSIQTREFNRIEPRDKYHKTFMVVINVVVS